MVNGAKCVGVSYEDVRGLVEVGSRLLYFAENELERREGGHRGGGAIISPSHFEV